LQRQHHGHLESPHVLRRHRAKQRASGGKRQPLPRGLRCARERTPALRVRLRRTGATGGEQERRPLIGRQQRHHARFVARRPALGDLRIRNRNRIAIAIFQLAQTVGRATLRQQARAACQQRRGKCKQEVQSVVAEIDAVAVLRKPARERMRSSEELLPGHRHAFAPADRRAWSKSSEQWNSRRHEATSGQTTALRAIVRPCSVAPGIRCYFLRCWAM
jgi:hypothetical protein